ncbi:MAG: hypothetical protein DRR08_14030 [Candidatus Parabeggiatoa sp. nov. 2]|nr:MAG: hypothetical protein B6247_26960 [Beggiatoa sp. 4572_84]RKZ59390.1 MAG: hypothetical protein DRR08_14030 [Gammaproteobacteria bacterium]
MLKGLARLCASHFQPQIFVIDLCELRGELNHKKSMTCKNVLIDVKSMTYKNVLIESDFISLCSLFIFHISARYSHDLITAHNFHPLQGVL